MVHQKRFTLTSGRVEETQHPVIDLSRLHCQKCGLFRVLLFCKTNANNRIITNTISNRRKLTKHLFTFCIDSRMY